MQRLALATVSIFLAASPALAADLDGPVYRERESYIERPAPPAVVERRIVERYNYYEPVETYAPPRRVYAPYAWSDRWYDGEYGYNYRRSAYYAGWPFWRHRAYYRHRGW
jgi:opacity protein-like surface antigen